MTIIVNATVNFGGGSWMLRPVCPGDMGETSRDLVWIKDEGNKIVFGEE